MILILCRDTMPLAEMIRTKGEARGEFQPCHWRNLKVTFHFGTSIWEAAIVVLSESANFQDLLDLFNTCLPCGNTETFFDLLSC